MQDSTAGCSPRRSHPAPSVPFHWQQVRVLLADDHRAYRLLIGSFLRTLGLAHESVNDGQAALEAMAAKPFHLVISDCRMPRMDGYAMTRELRRRETEAGSARIPVIALTAGLDLAQIQRCVACGMDDWMLKPITLEQLRDVLLYWLPGAASGTRQARPPTNVTRMHSRFPTRASLIATFGFWEAVEPLLFSLIQEAHDDLMALEQARNGLDVRSTCERLHRLVGSVAFLGDTGLEQRAIELITRVQHTGIAANKSLLDQLVKEIERYLSYLSSL
ncbi:response regulator [Pseudomonas sp. HN11]|uniref:response regulator n=1 Tax=Pseudomonas sp. HN11 TaxID=1344094 RepID=UPI001F2B9E9C|nr:response regulator [Pseudomonas sp. HN11]UII72539.1 response regulator [Pseudomonas sp. HN11]